MITVHDVANVIGIVGVGFILFAYLMMQMGKMQHHGLWYSFLNVFGAVFILYSLIFFWNLASFVIEVAWLLISFFGLIKAWRRRQSGDDSFLK